MSLRYKVLGPVPNVAKQGKHRTVLVGILTYAKLLKIISDKD